MLPDAGDSERSFACLVVGRGSACVRVLRKGLITDLILSKFPVFLGGGISLFSRHILADIQVNPGRKLNSKPISASRLLFECLSGGSCLVCTGFYFVSLTGVMRQLGQ